MSLIAIELETNRILVASARTSKNSFEIESAFEVPIEGASDSEAAEKLKSALAEKSLGRSDAIVVVSRSSAEMREITVPPAPDAELPGMVRMLARNEFASLNDHWLLDFLPMGTDPTASRNVLAIGISPEFRKQIETISTGAGIKIKHIVLRPFAAIDLLRSKLSDGKRRMIINPNDDQTDLTIVAGADPVAARSVRINANADADKRSKLLVGEIKRTLASSQMALGDQEIDQIIFLGDALAIDSTEGSLAERLNVDVAFVDPFKSTEVSSRLKAPNDAARYAGLLGSLVSDHGKQAHRIDFLNPRRTVDKTIDRSRLYLWGGVAALAALLAFGFCWWTLRNQSLEIANLKQNLADAKKVNAGNDNLPSVEQIMGEVSKIDEWKSSDINWLEELYQYSDRFLTPDDAIVDSFDAGLTRTEPRIVVRSRVAGVQKEDELIQSLDDRPYQVTPTKSGSDDEDPSYPMSFDFNILVAEEPGKIIKEIDEKAAHFLQERNQQRVNSQPAEAN